MAFWFDLLTNSSLVTKWQELKKLSNSTFKSLWHPLWIITIDSRWW